MIGKLVRLELKKIGWIRTLIVLLVLTLPLGYVYFVSNGGTKGYKEHVEPAQKFYDTVRGEATEEKYNSIMEQYKKLQSDVEGANGISAEEKGNYGKTIDEDLGIMSDALSLCDEFIMINDNRQYIIENATNNLESIDENDVYEIRYNKKVMARAAKLTPLKMMSGNNQYDSYFRSREYVFYLFPVLVILLCSIFTKEKESGMMALLKSSKEGRRKLFIAKYIAMVIVSVGVTLYFQIINFLGLCLNYGLKTEELWYSIRQVRVFNYSLYDYSIIKFIIIITLMRILAVVFVGTIIMIISMLSKNTILSAGVSALAVLILVGVPYYIINTLSYTSLDMLQMAEKLKNFICTWILFAGEYFMQYTTVNVFGYPVPDALMITLVSVLSCIVMALIACRIYCGKAYKKQRRAAT